MFRMSIASCVRVSLDLFGAQVRASTLFYRHLASNGQWRASLPKGEEALAVAAGTGWAAVATSNNFLRIFSSTGLQDGIVWLDGTVVCMVGHKDKLFVIYHGGLPVDGVQTLDFRYFRVDNGIRHCQAEGRVPLSTVEGCVLQWLGFTDRNMPAIMDSMGMVSVLAQQPGGWQWVPILDTGVLKKSEQDRYWPVACRGDRLLAVKLKGEGVYPETHPRPVTTGESPLTDLLFLSAVFVLILSLSVSWGSLGVEDPVRRAQQGPGAPEAGARPCLE